MSTCDEPRLAPCTIRERALERANPPCGSIEKPASDRAMYFDGGEWHRARRRASHKRRLYVGRWLPVKTGACGPRSQARSWRRRARLRIRMLVVLADIFDLLRENPDRANWRWCSTTYVKLCKNTRNSLCGLGSVAARGVQEMAFKWES